MSAIQFDKHIHRPIAELPELTPMVGKTVRITATDDAGIPPLSSLDQLRGTRDDAAFEGFDDVLREWRNEPWRAAEDE
jgi:hypothetical protein